MSEATTKKTTAKQKKWNRAVVEAIKTHYGVGEVYVNQALNGNRHAPVCESIRKDYARLCKVQEEAFSKALSK